MENLTPMLKQYRSIKQQHPDCILFFRLGDFYEMFYEDARTASSILDLVLTARDGGKSGKVPMCGIPYHSADSYISHLIKAGHKVAICEQMEDPALAKGLVKREVIRVITSGTFIDEGSSEPRILASIVPQDSGIGFAFLDTAGSSIRAGEELEYSKVIDIFAKLPVHECIFPESAAETAKKIFSAPILRPANPMLSPFEDWPFSIDIAMRSLCDHFKTSTLDGFGLHGKPLAVAAAGGLLEYARQMVRKPLLHIHGLSLYTETEYVYISPAACTGLELNDVVRFLDHTLTPMGRRLLRNWIIAPLKDIAAIRKRQDAVTLLKNDQEIRMKARGLLRNMPDIEKSLSRISSGYSHPRNLLALRNALCRLPEIQNAVGRFASENSLLRINDITGIRKLLEKAVNPDPPLSNPEGKVIRPGYDETLDRLREIQTSGREFLKQYQIKEAERTGIHNLKIGYTTVFGYYIEVSRANLRLVPQDYVRKQTLVNAERFTTSTLKEFEEKMISADSEVLKTEARIIAEIESAVVNSSAEIHQYAASITSLDALCSLAEVATMPEYVRPVVDDGMEILIKEGRHPVVENTLTGQFVPNDVLIDNDRNRLLVITGPNMAGKSTYVRQVAILVIMAQAGSYIPAESARIGFVDKIFTRIGARDEIAKGQSTFMVEMSETAGILNNLSERCLIILDEVGRGTSTFDGLSLAWAVAEYLQSKKVRTLFATHFHELTALADYLDGVKNYNVAVKEWMDEVIFLHRIVPGGTDDSYGIYVAKIAGIPQTVVRRAGVLLKKLEKEGRVKEKMKVMDNQLDLFLPDRGSAEEDRILDEIKSSSVDNITPLDALKKLSEWKKRLTK